MQGDWGGGGGLDTEVTLTLALLQSLKGNGIHFKGKVVKLSPQNIL